MSVAKNGLPVECNRQFTPWFFVLLRPLLSQDDGSPTQPLSAFIMSPNTGDIDDSSTTPPIPASPRPPSPNSLEALRLPGVIAKALCMLSVDELLGETPLVCMAWRKAAIMAFAEVASDLGGGSGSDGEVDSSEKAVRSQPARENRAMTDGSSSRGVWPLERLLTNFPWGSFLSEGACKQVRNAEAVTLETRRRNCCSGFLLFLGGFLLGKDILQRRSLDRVYVRSAVRSTPWARIG